MSELNYQQRVRQLLNDLTALDIAPDPRLVPLCESAECLAAEADASIEEAKAGLDEASALLCGLKTFHTEGGKIDMTLGGEAATHFMNLLVDFFLDNKGVNYVTLDVFREDAGRLSLTIQKAGGSTPADKLREADARIAALEQQLAEGGHGPAPKTSSLTFAESLVRASAVVDTWPEWKQNLLGRTEPQMRKPDPATME